MTGSVHFASLCHRTEGSGFNRSETIGNEFSDNRTHLFAQNL